MPDGTHWNYDTQRNMVDGGLRLKLFLNISLLQAFYLIY